ncbi:MAG: hypothetical protein ACOZAM_29505 [Pseudomonadota bacterium]
MGSAATAALWLGAPSLAVAGCVVGGPGVINCTGDMLAGATYSSGNTTLNTFDLSTNAGVIILNGSGGGGSGGTDVVGGNAGGGGGGTTTVLNYTGGGFTGSGLVARSNGGNGGEGGSGFATLVPPIGIDGGNGGGGGAGGSVTLTSSGNILTTADGIHGILAEANGGNGGDGGDVFSVGGLYGGGGDGGQGGVGGSVSVTTSTGTITTQGKGSAGIFAQSNGGVGGDGGSLDGAAIAGVGGSGAAPKDGGTVGVSNGGGIETYGIGSIGIIAQSIGGYAGSGGSATGLFAYGGSGASAGNGGIVTVGNSGSIHTRLEDAHGIFAQSVGGGGGAGGWSGGVVALGGSGGFGGAGKSVTVTNSATGVITTDGARSVGIFAQSVGGGGGDGGNSGGLVAIGGNSTGGGAGGTVVVTNAGKITTNGVSSQAILAQSIGGGGGNGGTSGGVVTIGGKGGGGGNADTVTVNNSGDLETWSNDSTALLAQSVGGGGGSGGGAYSGSAFVGFSLGGTGGKGGEGQKATVNLSSSSFDPAQIKTHGERSNGVTVQSVGGGGGNGGASVQTTVGYAGSLSIAIGGKAGDGGKGGDAELTGYADVSTTGVNADGILVQSVGGGGGSGGYAVSISAAAGESAAIAGSIGVGGAGGGGGDGGTVFVNAGGSIKTTNNFSEGLIAQSVGGGGGSGGYSVSIAVSGAGATAGAGAIGVGGSGGTGGIGGTVTATYTGNVETGGIESDGIVIQSIGGGGGNGGFSVAAAVSGSGTGAGAVGIGVGGSGGTGGNGGVVTGTVNGNITTTGAGSNALIVQSVGGGGGSGGFNVTGTISGAGTGSGAISIGVGGSGGGGGDGEAVTAKLNGNATTGGVDADAVVIQSVGGGGGNGGFNVSGTITGAGTGSGSAAVGVGGAAGLGGDGKVVIADVIGNIKTTGNSSNGFTAQSIGGGGGNGGFNVSAAISVSGKGAGAVGVGVGGMAGDGGNAEKVDVSVTGNIETTKDDSVGYLAQSLGGGGGNGGFNVSGTIGAASTGAGAVSVGVGGAGADGGYSGVVFADQNGNITTAGKSSTGFIAQSIGGGGGNGGFNVSGGISAAGEGAVAVSVGVGGMGGGGGNAEAVTATITGDIKTGGERSQGVIVQSIGGGGGNGAFNVTGTASFSQKLAGAVGIGVGGFGGGGGDARKVTSTLTGDIETKGKEATGLFVQSLGGGGGNGGFNVTAGLAGSSEDAGTLGVGVGGFGGDGGDGWDVVSNSTGNITTEGIGAKGAVIQSLGGAGGTGGINVTGNVTLSGGQSAAIGIGVGGFGGGGGDSLTVTGSHTGNITTDGYDADGILVQSVGGGGGSGGLNVTGSISASISTSGAVGFGLGGFGGDGGKANDVDFDVIGNVTTKGDLADAVLIQSIGGGGGNGALNVTGNLGLSLSGSTGAAGLGIGGFGGGGGDAGNVTASVTGIIIANGEKGVNGGLPVVIDGVNHWLNGSNGVVAQSIGGGGGNGGLNVSGSISASAIFGSSYAMSLGLGGFGGDGGDAGTVNLTVKSPTVVSSVGDNRAAVIAQSLGGGGGNGALNVSGSITFGQQVTVGVGGFGGEGGVGRAVTVDAEGKLVARGVQARGLLAQSIGGGGGDGGINISGGVTLSADSTKPNLSFGLGGFGGDGNKAGDVIATQKGEIDVGGTDSIGILVQSVGGGGGSGGLNVSADISLGQSYSAAFGIGGNAGTGASGGNVTLTSDGKIVVASNVAVSPEDEEDYDRAKEKFGERGGGILAQSIGGGGGLGGINASGVIAPKGNPIVFGLGGSGGAGGDAGTVTVKRGLTTASLIKTTGDESNGLTAQSIGGGGGDAGMNLGISASGAGGTQPKQLVVVIGGSGGAAGNGAKVDVTHKGDIETAGLRSDGLLAQSIGGGGGNANLNIGGGINKNASGLNLAIGGGTGDGGIGGEVVVDHTGNISTQKNDSSAIYAQSVGGGGGNTKTSLAYAGGIKNELKIAIGREGGAGADAGDVTVTSNGTLTTKGDNAVGIVAQSIGGGGGMSSATQVGVTARTGEDDSEKASLNIAIGIKGGDSGIGKAVKVTASGSIATEGEKSAAILAQSIGGGGGVGGGVMNTIVKENVSARVGIGGDGGTGSDAGIVTVINSARLTTKKANSAGISAQSTGGGGGVGGYAIQASLSTKLQDSKESNSASLTIGGTGGNGGNGDQVTVNNSGYIGTEGQKSYGIEARSVGGGGGEGGLAFVGAVGVQSTANSLEMAVGGKGGDGGEGGIVEVLNEGTISTTGEEASGIHALSIGGGGGDAGLVANLALSVPTGQNTSKRVLINIGGEGGEGGISKNVTVTNRPDSDDEGGYIQTTGKKAHGIYAQSIGGGGGNGSSVISLAFTATGGKNSTVMGLNIGGKGGSGNEAGDVTVINKGTIVTSNEEAYGIFAQSVGGGGGNGGIALAANAIIAAKGTAPVVAIGGFGGSGGDAGQVKVENTGIIQTTGKNAHGIVAQSIGGGGGNANVGIGVGGVASLIANPLSFALGAGCVALECYGGGAGGPVIVNQFGTVSVSGEGAQAIKAESLNGGGGSLVIDLEGITTLPGGSQVPEAQLLGFDGDTPVDRTTKEPVVTLIAGADRSANSTAGAVTINVTGNTYAQGDFNTGAGVQAVGGGGGNIFAKVEIDDETAVDPMKIAQILGGTGGTENSGGDIVDSALTGEVGIWGKLGSGLFIQTVGGGGGRSNIQLTSIQGMIGGGIDLRLGGTDGNNETGGDIKITQSGLIYTEGKASFGSLVQSIGGGGGYGTFNINDGAEPPPAARGAGLMSTASVMSLLSTATVTLGADGGSGLDAGDIDFTKNDGTGTTDDLAVALIKQSIGGGGGTEVPLDVDELFVNLGGTSGASGNGGSVKLTNNGAVQTSGAQAHGILLQSIGGGGGFVTSDAGAVTTTLRGDNTGNGGAVTLIQNNDVVTKGGDAFGIIAQSIGGGGGLVNGAFAGLVGDGGFIHDTFFAGSAGGSGNGGTVTLDLNGSVVTEGARSTAVFAQSAGEAGGDIKVMLAAGKFAVGGTQGTSVAFDGGATNTFTNNGSVFTDDEIEGFAVTGTWGNDSILNNYYMAGNVDLGTGANGYTNAQNALFEMGALVNLNDGANKLLNNGILAPGASNLIDTVYTTALKGNIEQSITGFYVVDLDFVAGDAITGNADRINATGEAALKGTVDLRIVNPTQVSPGYHEVTILSAEGGVTDKSLGLKAPASAVAKYEILYPNPEDVVLSYDIDFAGSNGGGVNRNQARLGDYINRFQTADSKTQLAPLVGYLFLLPTIEDLRAAYEMLTPEVYASNLASTLMAVDDFSQALMSCRQASGEYHFVAQGECGWMRVSGRTTSYDKSFQYSGYEEDVYQVAGGIQKSIGDNRFVGFGLSYESTDARMSDLADVEGDRVQAGVVFKGRVGGTTAVASFIGGYGWFDTTRRVALGDLGGVAEATQQVGIAATRIQIAHAYDFDNSYLRFGVDAAVSALFQDDFTEKDGGLGNLAVQDHTNANGFVMPFVEFGGETATSDGGTLLRAWSKLAIVQYIDPDTRVYTGLIGPSGDVSPFYADAEFDSTLGRLELGLDMFSPGGVVIGLTGVGIMGEDVESYQGNAKVSVPF